MYTLFSFLLWWRFAENDSNKIMIERICNRFYRDLQIPSFNCQTNIELSQDIYKEDGEL